MRTAVTVALVTSAGVFSSAGRAEPPKGWLFPDSTLRVPVTVEAGLYPRTDHLIAWPVDFAALMKDAGVAGSLDPNAIRVAVENDTGQQAEIPSRFLPGAEAAAGELVWTMSGAVTAMESRRYDVYFDALGSKPRPAPEYPPIAGLEKRPTNQVRNPGFEQVDPKDGKSPAEWRLMTDYGGEGSLEVVTDPVHGGKHALKITVTKNGRVACLQEKLPMKPNTLYRVSAWVRAAPGADQDADRKMYVLADPRRADNSSFPKGHISGGGAATAGAWRQLVKQGPYEYRNDVLTPPETASCSIYVAVSADVSRGISALGDVFVDDVEILEIRPESRIPPVTIEPGAVETMKGMRP